MSKTHTFVGRRSDGNLNRGKPPSFVVLKFGNYVTLDVQRAFTAHKMASKRKRDTELGSTGAERPGSSSLRQQKVINRPLAGTKAYTTGQGVKDGLKSGSVDGEL